MTFGNVNYAGMSEVSPKMTPVFFFPFIFLFYYIILMMFAVSSPLHIL